MSTNTFDRKIVITNPGGISLLEEMENSGPEEPKRSNRQSLVERIQKLEERIQTEILVEEWLSSLENSSEKK